MSDSAIDYNELITHLTEDFKEVRTCAARDIGRLRKLVDAVIVCRPPDMKVKAEDFDVKALVNELKTVERYIKREVERTTQH